MRKIELKDNKLTALPNREDMKKLEVDKIGKVYIYIAYGGLVFKLHHISESYRDDDGIWGWIMMNNSFGYGGTSKDKCKTIEEAITSAIKGGHKVYQVTQKEMFEQIIYNIEKNNL